MNLFLRRTLVGLMWLQGIGILMALLTVPQTGSLAERRLGEALGTYELLAFPLVLFLAPWARRENGRRAWRYIGISLVLFILYFALALLLFARWG